MAALEHVKTKQELVERLADDRRDAAPSSPSRARQQGCLVSLWSLSASKIWSLPNHGQKERHNNKFQSGQHTPSKEKPDAHLVS